MNILYINKNNSLPPSLPKFYFPIEFNNHNLTILQFYNTVSVNKNVSFKVSVTRSTFKVLCHKLGNGHNCNMNEIAKTTQE